MTDYDPGTGQPPTQGPAGPSGPRASFGERLVAALIDGVLVGVINTLLTIGLRGAGGGLGLLIDFAYFGFFEGGPAGQTVGKRVMNIRVIRYDTGGPLGWGTALLRHLCRILSSIPCFLGFLWMLWDKEKMTWHDKLSGTVVVPTSTYPPPPDGFGKPPQ